MSVQTDIGFFQNIVDKTQMFSQQHNLRIQPPARPSDVNIEDTGLKIKGDMRDSDGASGVMHWNFHKWGDVDNVVGE